MKVRKLIQTSITFHSKIVNTLNKFQKMKYAMNYNENESNKK